MGLILRRKQFMGPKNKKRVFAQNRFFNLYTKLKSSASRSLISMSEGLEPPQQCLKNYREIPKKIQRKLLRRIGTFGNFLNIAPRVLDPRSSIFVTYSPSFSLWYIN